MLHGWADGSEQDLQQLTPLVYEQLRVIAQNAFRSERSDHTLQATALVHEAYARLIDVEVEWRDRSHFFSLAARMMRRILVSHARAHSAAKRGDGIGDLLLDDVIAISPETSGEILNLHEALEALEALDARKATILELRYFSGMTYEEMGEVMGLSTSTLDREMRFAKAWLRDYLER
ncbi:MAG: ECF-type sigma factor [Pseudomonadota bacterium]